MEKEIFFIAAILSVLVFVIDISLLKYFKIAEVDFLNRSLFVPILSTSMILMLIFCSPNAVCMDFCVGTMAVVFLGSIFYQACKNKSIITGIAVAFFQNSIVLVSVIPVLLFLLYILGY